MHKQKDREKNEQHCAIVKSCRIKAFSFDCYCMYCFCFEVVFNVFDVSAVSRWTCSYLEWKSSDYVEPLLKSSKTHQTLKKKITQQDSSHYVYVIEKRKEGLYNKQSKYFFFFLHTRKETGISLSHQQQGNALLRTFFSGDDTYYTFILFVHCTVRRKKNDSYLRLTRHFGIWV